MMDKEKELSVKCDSCKYSTYFRSPNLEKPVRICAKKLAENNPNAVAVCEKCNCH